MKFTNTDVLLSYMAFQVLKGILKYEKEYKWFQQEILKSFNDIHSIVTVGNKKEKNWDQLQREIKDYVFSPPYLGMLFIDKDPSSPQQAVELAYEHMKDVYHIYIKRIPSTSEFYIYKYLSLTHDADLYNVNVRELKAKLKLYSNPKFNRGNIEKSTIVISNYLKKYYKHYYL